METPIIPSNFTQWRHCIVHECGIELNKPFIEQRIASLSNQKDQHTKQFVRLYGEAHYQKTLQWFHQALSEMV